MRETTFIAKNHESGVLHAYRYTGSHFRRRCGASGRQQIITSGSGVSKVSAEWYVKQSDACRKCRASFDVESASGGKIPDELREIADQISTSSDSITPVELPREVIMKCPVPDCGYTGELASVAAHISGKKDEAHEWQSLGFEGANDFKRTFSSVN